MHNCGENPSNLNRSIFFRNILITDEIVVRPGAESCVAAVEEGGAEGQGGRALGQTPHLK